MNAVVEQLKIDAGYSGKSEQWRYGFDLACRELQKRLAVPDGYCVVPKEPTTIMTMTGSLAYDATFSFSNAYKAMIEAAQEQD